MKIVMFALMQVNNKKFSFYARSERSDMPYNNARTDRTWGN